MTLTDFFIRRPVFAISLTLLIVFVGLISYSKLSLRLFPKIETAKVSIAINYPGASAHTVQGFVVNKIQNTLSGLEGVDYITSSSEKGGASIDLYLKEGQSADLVAMSVMQKLSSIRGQLPDNMKDPVISTADVDDNPVMLFAFTSKQLKPSQIFDYLDRVVKPQLESVSGVAEAQVLGPTYAMRIWLNTQKMSYFKVSMQDVLAALKGQNIQSNAGQIDGHASLDIELTSTIYRP